MNSPERQIFKMKHLPFGFDIAPDKSEIRKLMEVNGGSLVHCTLQPQKVSHAVCHKKIEEIWYFIQGSGEVWRKRDDLEEVVKVRPGVCINIPPKTHFQFRNKGTEPLCFVIATMPPWPGKHEAFRVKDFWRTE